MLRIILILTLAVLAFVTITNAEYYAVLIVGDNPAGDGETTKTWDGGRDDPYDELWSDLYLMWETLFTYGWNHNNIYVLFGDGEDCNLNYGDYNADNYYLDPWFIEELTDDSAYYEDVEDIFDYLDGEMTEDDFLFVWTFGHGTPVISGSDTVNLCLMDDEMDDDYFESLLPTDYDERLFWMQQCYAGGFIDELENNNTVIMTACSATEMAYSANNTCPDFGDIEEWSWFGENFFCHGEFNYHTMNAARGVTIIPAANESDSADTNADGETSVYEIWCWENTKDNSISTPQFDDNGSISTGMYLDIPPYTPENFSLGTSAGGYVELSWDENIDYDFNYYQIHRALQDYPDPPGSYSLLTTISNRSTTSYIDEDFSPGTGNDGAGYKIRVYDLGGHISPFSEPVTTHGDINGHGAGGASFIAGGYNFIAIPNPFNPRTAISYKLEETSNVNLSVYDINGRQAANLAEGLHSAGVYSAEFNAEGLSSGVYFAVLNVEGNIQTQKLLLMK